MTIHGFGKAYSEARSLTATAGALGHEKAVGVVDEVVLRPEVGEKDDLLGLNDCVRPTLEFFRYRFETWLHAGVSSVLRP